MSHSNLVSHYHEINGTQVLSFACHTAARFTRIEAVLNKHNISCVTVHVAHDDTLTIEFRPSVDSTFVRDRKRFTFTTPAELTQVILTHSL